MTNSERVGDSGSGSSRGKEGSRKKGGKGTKEGEKNKKVGGGEVGSQNKPESPDRGELGVPVTRKEDLKDQPDDSTEARLLRRILGETISFRKQMKTQLEEIRSTISSQTTAINQLLERLAKAASPADEQVLMKTIDAMEKKLVESVEGFSNVLDKVNASINQEQQIFEENREMIALFMRELERMQEAQGITESLRIPSLDRMAARLKGDFKEEYEKSRKVGDKDWTVENEIYQNMVEDWFEEHIRAMESSELAFEEQPDMYRYLSLYASNFAKTEGMKDFGERIQAKLEARRIRHRAVRVLSMSPPDAIVNVMQNFKVQEMSNFFRGEVVGSYSIDKATGTRARGTDGEVVVINHVERELRNYERMMRILRERRDEYRKKYLEEEERMKKRLGVRVLDYGQRVKLQNNPELKRLSEEIKVKEKYIVDYYTYGGHIEDEGIDGAYVDEEGNLQDRWNEELGSQSNDNRDGFFYRLGTDRPPERQGRKIESYGVEDLVKSHIREGKDPVSRDKEIELRDKFWARRYAGGTLSLMFRISREVQRNGTADFYLNRIYNFGDKVAENFLLRHTREIWDPTEGVYKGDQISLGYIDIMSDMLSKAKENQLKRVGINKKREDHNGAFLSFENLDWGSKELWDDLIQGELAVNPATPSVKGQYVAEADGSGRKPMWGPDSLLHGPTVEKTAIFEHMGGWLGTGPAEPFCLPGSNEPIEVSKQEKFQIEIMDRMLNYLRSDEAKDQLGDPIIGYSEKATICEWINSWVRHGMIDSKVSKVLFEKYLGTSNKTLLRIISTSDIIWNDLKNNWGTMSLQGIGEFIKRLFGYIFADEFR